MKSILFLPLIMCSPCTLSDNVYASFRRPDRAFTISDISIMLQIIVGGRDAGFILSEYELSQVEMCGDYNNDGNIFINDVAFFLQYIIGRIGVAPHHATAINLNAEIYTFFSTKQNIFANISVSSSNNKLNLLELNIHSSYIKQGNCSTDMPSLIRYENCLFASNSNLDVFLNNINAYHFLMYNFNSNWNSLWFLLELSTIPTHLDVLKIDSTYLSTSKKVIRLNSPPTPIVMSLS